jgi:NADP-dependent 3-hydroxy acid dehydrogenase YdfG
MTIENKGGEALVVIADVTKKVDMEKLVDKTLKEYGTVHAIINNAGLMPLSFCEKLKTDEVGENGGRISKCIKRC